MENKYRLLDRKSSRLCVRFIVHVRFLIITKRGCVVGRSQRDINARVCVREHVGIRSRRFNVYHRDICGCCTCIINALALLAVAVQSLQRHVIVRAVLSRIATLANDSFLRRLLLPPRFVDDTERR